MSLVVVAYTGTDPEGQPQTGQQEVGSVAEFVKACHSAGWRSLNVWNLDTTPVGEAVGQIGTDEHGASTWWAAV